MLDLIEDDEAAKRLEREDRIGEPGPVAGILEVEPRHRVGITIPNHRRECALAHLPRSDQRGHGELIEQGLDLADVAWSVQEFQGGIRQGSISIEQGSDHLEISTI
jgi:hypothetical protein